MLNGKLVKISRYGEMFWLRDVEELRSGVYVGTVDNDTSGPLKFGDLAPFARCEVIEMMDYPKPRLIVV